MNDIENKSNEFDTKYHMLCMADGQSPMRNPFVLAGFGLEFVVGCCCF